MARNTVVPWRPLRISHLLLVSPCRCQRKKRIVLSLWRHHVNATVPADCSGRFYMKMRLSVEAILFHILFKSLGVCCSHITVWAQVRTTSKTFFSQEVPTFCGSSEVTSRTKYSHRCQPMLQITQAKACLALPEADSHNLKVPPNICLKRGGLCRRSKKHLRSLLLRLKPMPSSDARCITSQAHRLWEIAGEG